MHDQRRALDALIRGLIRSSQDDSDAPTRAKWRRVEEVFREIARRRARFAEVRETHDQIRGLRDSKMAARKA